MNNLLATVITGLVIDENAKAYFVQKDGVTFMLDKAEGEHKIGDMVKGFAYTDMHQKPFDNCRGCYNSYKLWLGSCNRSSSRLRSLFGYWSC